MSSRGQMGPPPRNLYQLDTIPVVSSADFTYISDTSNINKLCKVSLGDLATFFGGGGGSGTVTSVNITQPAAGITTSGGPITTSGSITLALADDLAAVEGLATTGVVKRTASNTWSAGAVDADEIVYDNATSGLSATEVQAAIDELASVVTAVGLGGLYGDGSNGSYSASSGNADLSAILYQRAYTDVTLTGTATLDVQGRAIFINGQLDLSAPAVKAIHCNGLPGVGVNNGATLSLGNRQTPGTGTSTAGGATATGAGLQSSAPTAVNMVITSDSIVYSNNGAGGAGGSSGPRAGGAIRQAATAQIAQPLMTPPFDPSIGGSWVRSSGISTNTTATLIYGCTNAGSTGGGGGAGSGTQVGTQGGGAGATAGPLLIYAKEILVSASTPAGVLQAVGGAGGNSAAATNANAAAGGGGGGGQGGLVVIVTDKITATDGTTSVADAIWADGGAGGNAGNSNGTATAGQGGYGGRAGRAILWVRGTGQIYYAGGASSSAPVGQTGSAGGQARLSLPVG